MQALGGPYFQRFNRLACEAIRCRLRLLTDQRRGQSDIAGCGEAIRRLVELGLKAKK
jgi:hypothetical protein